MSERPSPLLAEFAICVAGVPGTGKTTLIQSHVKRETQDWQVTGSSIVKKIIAPSSVQEMDEWSPEQREIVREQAIDALRQLQGQCPGRLLVDGHFTLRNRSTGVLESIFTQGDQSFYKALVLLDLAPERVLAQRATDGRNRRPESLECIAAHIERERLEGRRLAELMGVPLLELDEADLSQSLQRLSKFLNEIAPLELA